jgi:NADH-quinone oxidoreductase subunit B
VLQGIDTMIPVDVYVPGCPPSPEGLIHAFMRLQEMVQKGETHSQRRLSMQKDAAKYALSSAPLAAART